MNEVFIHQSFNNDFCQHLEFHLSRALLSKKRKMPSFWCDGILMPDNDEQLSLENIVATKKIKTEAYAGLSGQDKYTMIIKLGTRAIEYCVKGLNLKDCLPDEESPTWVNIDMEGRIIEVQLN